MSPVTMRASVALHAHVPLDPPAHRRSVLGQKNDVKIVKPRNTSGRGTDAARDALEQFL
jgi:hypothetical protein